MNLNLPKAQRCRRCGAAIVWVVSSEARRPMPLDYEPTERGNVFVRYEDGRLIGQVKTNADPRPRGIAFMPHHATCGPTIAARKPKSPAKPKPPEPPSLF